MHTNFITALQTNLQEEFGGKVTYEDEKEYKTSAMREWLGVGPMKISAGWDMEMVNSTAQQDISIEEVDTVSDTDTDDDERNRRIEGLDDDFKSSI